MDRDKKKVEQILYRHYNKKNNIHKLERSIEFLKKRKKDIMSDIKENRYELEVDIKGISYEGVRVQTSGVSSAIEDSLMFAYKKLENELAMVHRKLCKKRIKLRELERQVYDIDEVINGMDQDSVRICEMIYCDGFSIRKVGGLMFVSSATIHRMKQKIIKNLQAKMGL